MDVRQSDDLVPRPAGLPVRMGARVALLALVALSMFWTFWGSAEMFHEGWWGGVFQRLRYLIPGGVCLILACTAIRFPRTGGVLLIAVGLAFGGWWWQMQAGRGISIAVRLGNLPYGGSLAVLGLGFFLEARRQRGLTRKQRKKSVLRMLLLAACSCLAVVLVMAASILPGVLMRVDDGLRGERLIVGDSLQLVWAPAGPGWSWGDEQGDNLSWNEIALFGLEPRGFDLRNKPGFEQGQDASLDDMDRWGLFRYLDSSGVQLEDEPVDIWRMPGVHELVDALCRAGVPVGASWDGHSTRARFADQPKKETPLWAPDQPAIYFWARDEFGPDRAHWVSYNGWVQQQPKSWGNPRHGHRFVRDP